ncbi:MAG TPA: cupin [Anaerolineae bacterium]|nr:cupin [Anaerolineae bacterium]HMR63566.1 cupin [Anaerolineae bacterium]
MELKVYPWIKETAPKEEELRNELVEQELNVYHWSSPPNDTLLGHTHGYHKIIYVVSGAIKFEFPSRHQSLSLRAGDKLELPAGIRHNAIVGVDGVRCLEAHIY